LKGPAGLPSLAEFSIQYAFTNRFASIEAISNALVNMCQNTIDGQFSSPGGFESLKVFKLGVQVMFGREVDIGSEDGLENMVKDCLPSIFGVSGRAYHGHPTLD